MGRPYNVIDADGHVLEPVETGSTTATRVLTRQVRDAMVAELARMRTVAGP